jgi:hypothetical protein
MSKGGDVFIGNGSRGAIMGDIRDEVTRATIKHPTPIRSVAEGLAIVEEEAFELKLECYKSKKDYKAVYEELIQAAAMCVRMADDLGLRKKANA